MKAIVLHGPRDIRFEELPDPEIVADTDAIVRVAAACVCGSDLWPYRGISGQQDLPRQIGHEFIGVVEQVGTQVGDVRVGDFVIAPFLASCGECANCLNGVTPSCLNGTGYEGCQAELVRVPLADGTLYPLPEHPSQDRWADLLALSDVFPTGHHAALSAGVKTGSTAAVVGDGAVGLSAVLAAVRLGAETVIAMSSHPYRAELATQFGAHHIVNTRGKEGAAAVRELTGGIGADAVLECVGTADSFKQAFMSTRPGGMVGYVGIPHDVELNVPVMFAKNTGLAGGIAPVRAYLDELVPEVLVGDLRPGAVFDTTHQLAEAAAAYRAMDERTSIKAMLVP